MTTNNKPTNKQFLSALKSDMATSSDVRSVLEAVALDDVSGAEMYSLLVATNSRANDFVSSLLNPTFINKFYDKLYTDKLAYFLNGDLPFGDSVQGILTKRNLPKCFGENFDSGHASAEGDLIAKIKPIVYSNIMTVNFQHKFKVSIEMRELKKAMMEEYGLFEFVQNLLMRNVSDANKQEFDDIHHLIDGNSTKSYCEGTSYSKTTMPKGIIHQAVELAKTKTKIFQPCVDSKELCKKIIQYSGDLEEYSYDFNIAKDENDKYEVEMFSRKEDLVLVTTNEMYADMNVETLATAFHLDKIDLPKRILTVKNLGQEGITIESKKYKVLGILMDRDLIQCWDTFKQTAQFTNVEGKYYNSFLHHEGIKAINPYAQFVIFTQEISQ